jgi:hypothetical protein
MYDAKVGFDKAYPGHNPTIIFKVNRTTISVKGDGTVIEHPDLPYVRVFVKDREALYIFPNVDFLKFVLENALKDNIEPFVLLMLIEKIAYERQHKKVSKIIYDYEQNKQKLLESVLYSVYMSIVMSSIKNRRSYDGDAKDVAGVLKFMLDKGLFKESRSLIEKYIYKFDPTQLNATLLEHFIKR